MEDRIALFFKNHNISPKGESSRSYIFDCPACGGDSKLYIEKTNGRAVCFKKKTDKCPKPGSQPVYALSLVSGLSIDTVKKEILEFVRDLADDIRVDFSDTKKEDDRPLVPGSLPADSAFLVDPRATDGINYLANRGLPLEIQKQYDILYSQSMRRVIFPVIMGKILYGWQGRAIDKVDKAYRMYNMEGDWRARTLMFYNNIVDKDFAIIAEGPISALKFHKVGNFVASMGKEISKHQLELLRKANIKKLYIALDRDALDKLKAISYYMDNELLGSIKCYFIKTPDKRDDFGDSTFEECEEAFRNAEPIVLGEDIFVNIETKYK